MSTPRSCRAKSLVQGYIRKVQKALNLKLIIPNDIIVLFFNFYFIKLDSLILDDDKDMNDFFDLLSTQISIERLENAKLLLRATRDGGDEKTMFQKLTNNGPYLFIIKSSDDYIFGGYCTANIEDNKSCTYLYDAKAFVYVLRGVPSQKQVIYKIKSSDGKNAIFYNGYGFWFLFGPSGADLLIYPGLANQYNDSKHYCCKNRNGNLWYDIPLNQSLVGTNYQYQFKMKEMEIFKL